MDLISIFQTVWRHRFATIPVIVLTALGAFYVIAIKPPIYQASAGLLLINPPGPPTPAQIAKDPKLGKISTSNTFVSFGNLDVVADAVIGVVTAEADQLVSAGVNPNYQLALSTDVGLPPMIQITGEGPTAQEAVKSAALVSQAAETGLYSIQATQGVNNLYMIKAVELYSPKRAQLSASGKLRTLIAVLALGIILLFVVVSIADVAEKRRVKKFVDDAMATDLAEEGGTAVGGPDDRRTDGREADHSGMPVDSDSTIQFRLPESRKPNSVGRTGAVTLTDDDETGRARR